MKEDKQTYWLSWVAAILFAVVMFMLTGLSTLIHFGILR